MKNMNKEKMDNNFLARWVAGDLSFEELEAFKKSKDYAIYKKINEKSQLFEVPKYNLEEGLLKIQNKISKKKNPKLFKLSNTIYKVAASVIILFGLFYFFNLPQVHNTTYGEKLTFNLPDNSIVHLNANSKIEYIEKNWDENRTLSLIGEAFFEVEKGSNFKVNTPFGTVEVLGTKFTVISNKNYIEVHCYEGKVRVNTQGLETILNPKDAFRNTNSITENWKFKDASPTWLNGETTFYNTPLKQVLIALENEFGIHFNKKNIDSTQRFTGSFTHNDIDTALKTVFVPMNISFTFNDENSIVLVKK